MRAVVIVEPEIPENTGFIARLSANFGYEMRLVNPDFNLSEARKTASGAQEKLRETRIFSTVAGAVKDLDYVVGTKPGKGTGLRGFTPRENTSVMLGRESSGLTNDELELCDAVVSIETGDYDSLNQSHAASIMMYEFSGAEESGVSSKQKNAIAERVESNLILELLLRSNPTESEFKRLMADLNSF